MMGKRKTTEAIVLLTWLNAIRNGTSLADAMKGWVPADELSIISAGEISGNLSKSFDDIIYINDTKKKVKSALAGIIYPVVWFLQLASTYIFSVHKLFLHSQVFYLLRNGRALVR